MLWSTRNHCTGRPPAALQCGALTWNHSSADAVRASGVPLMKAAHGRPKTGNAPATPLVVAVEEARMTRNVNGCRSVCTTAIAVTVTRSRLPTSACPTT